nr:MAG TPA: helix-turn-helix domain protein [Caudoviricetes sp.]
MEVGKRLRRLRQKKKETIAKVSFAVKVAPSTLTAYELGDRTPRDDVKKRIAKYYGMTVEDIFFK